MENVLCGAVWPINHFWKRAAVPDYRHFNCYEKKLLKSSNHQRHANTCKTRFGCSGNNSIHQVFMMRDKISSLGLFWTLGNARSFSCDPLMRIIDSVSSVIWRQWECTALSCSRDQITQSAENGVLISVDFTQLCDMMSKILINQSIKLHAVS